VTLEQYRDCLALARRHARGPVQAGDLLHEALLAGARAGRLEFSASRDRAWLAGTLRNIAAEMNRSDSRRRAREARYCDGDAVPDDAHGAADARAVDRILATLSAGTRRVAVLALHGLDAREIQYALGLKPPAFRQRLVALRRSLGSLPQAMRAEALALAYSEPRRAGPARLDLGLIRRALLHHVRESRGIGTHDPDGHLVAIRPR
jgi:DNA-directed RNA polymerase specialized sigma24 family protein